MGAEANILAAAKLRAKTPVGSVLNTQEWSQVPLALRERAFFSAEVEKVRLLSRMQSSIQTALDGVRRAGKGANGGPGAFQTREKFVTEMQSVARSEGLDPRGPGAPGGFAQPERYGTMRDITSSQRLRLIYDHQTASAQEFARWKAEQDPDVLDAYPAQEFIRVEKRKMPRTNWPQRWDDAGGQFFSGKMIALKNDPVWAALSRFGTPYPPFDFGSGMGLRDVSRRDAEKLGLIKPGERPKPAEQDFNAKLEASVAELSPEYRRQLQSTFGDQIAIEGDTVQWRGNLLGDLYQQAVTDKSHQDRVSLGAVTPATVQMIQSATGLDLTGHTFDIGANDVRHAVSGHGEPGTDRKGKPTGEQEPDQRPLTQMDFQLLPFVLREPDRVVPGTKSGSFRLEKDIDGKTVATFLQRSVKNQLANIVTMWVKK
jgi:hypothetical protein